MTSTTKLDFPAMQLAVFRGEDPGGVIWQPRLDYWYNVNKQNDTLPDHLKDASLLDVYDYCHASCRYSARSDPWMYVSYNNVEVTEEWETEDTVRHTWHTPVGTLTQLRHYDEWHVSSHITEYRLKSADDFKILQYLYEDEVWHWNEAQFQADKAKHERYSAPQFYFRRSPAQRLVIEEMGLENTIFFMVDHPDLFEDYMAFATAADDVMYRMICDCPVQLLNLGENIDGFIDSPPFFRDHLIPYYNKRLDELHAAGKYVSIHFDGVMRPLLPFIKDTRFDAIEAATPQPQGDVTIEEIKDALGDKILVDGIPALYFMQDQCSEETLVEFMHRVIDLFHPRLILGVSDEVPPPSDIERVRLVGELVQQLG
jgi:hypothetical protein